MVRKNQKGKCQSKYAYTQAKCVMKHSTRQSKPVNSKESKDYAYYKSGDIKKKVISPNNSRVCVKNDRD